ncbi:hypothetical protein V6N13_138173 [Hibiscus sabdariffa]
MHGYRDRGGGGGPLDRKRINDAPDKHLDKSTPSTSRGSRNSKDKGRPSVPSAPAGKSQLSHRDSRSKADEESETDNEESDISASDEDDTSWISWFCGLRGNEFFCEVDEEYIQDEFNLCGLSSQVPYYDYALDLILDVESSHSDMFTEEQNELVESAAEMLYGLIHVRFILTSKGMSAMVNIVAIFPVFYLPSVDFVESHSQSSTHNFCLSWRNTETMILEDALEFIAVDNPAFQLVNLIFLVQVP